MPERRNILTEMLVEGLMPHPSGECRCNYPGTIIVCSLPALHDGDHEGYAGRTLGTIAWPQNRPQEAPHG